MLHLGDITKIDWYRAEPVDVVTGGSPCQDLSIAGRRAGLAGERSGLFMEQIRCIKELRKADVQRGRTGKFIRPRFMVWENVPGAFSSGEPKGADFAAVIEEIIKVAEPGAAVAVCVPDRGWPKSGCYYAEDGSWSIAWRVHDAQFWGVPQRRKRIALVTDLGGLAAPEVLFERKGLSGDLEQGGAERETTAGAAGSGAGRAISFQERAGCPGGGKGILIQNERTGALSTLNNQSVFAIPLHDKATRSQGGGPTRNGDGAGNGLCVGSEGDPCPTLSCGDRHMVCAGFSAGQGEKAGGIGWQEECSPSLKAGESGTNRTPAVFDARGNGDGQTVCTLTGDHQSRTTDYTALCVSSEGGEIAGTLDTSYYKGTGERNGKERTVVCIGNGQLNQMSMSEQANTLDTMHDQQCVMVSGLDCRNGRENGDLCGTLQSKPNGGFSYNCIHPVRIANVVRRLTPLECERLQGYPDGWTNIGDWTDSKGKKHKAADSPRYKALGNSIALPFWKWLLKRISAQYERDATLGSLFDGIGGFPYLWEQINGKGSARWASEIEEFPIAVTKRRLVDTQTAETEDAP